MLSFLGLWRLELLLHPEVTPFQMSASFNAYVEGCSATGTEPPFTDTSTSGIGSSGLMSSSIVVVLWRCTRSAAQNPMNSCISSSFLHRQPSRARLPSAASSHACLLLLPEHAHTLFSTSAALPSAPPNTTLIPPQAQRACSSFCNPFTNAFYSLRLKLCVSLKSKHQRSILTTAQCPQALSSE